MHACWLIQTAVTYMYSICLCLRKRKKEKKVYAVRRYNGSFCTQKHPRDSALCYDLHCMECRDKIILLNKTTEIINFWQDSEVKKTVEEARAAFPDCMFSGSD